MKSHSVSDASTSFSQHGTSGVFLGILDDANPGNVRRDVEPEVVQRRTLLIRGVVNAFVACGVRPWILDAAAVMNPFLADLWNDGWWRDALTGKHVEVLSRGDRIFDDYNRWTKDQTRHPNNGIQDKYVEDLQSNGILGNVSLPFGETASEFEDQVWHRLNPELEMRVQREEILPSRVEEWRTSVKMLRDEESRRAKKLVPLSRVQLRLGDNSGSELARRFPEFADTVIRESDGAYLDSFASKKNLCALMPMDSGPVPAWLRDAEHFLPHAEEDLWWPGVFAEERVERLGFHSVAQIVSARDRNRLAAEAGGAFERIWRGSGSAADQEVLQTHIREVAGALANSAVDVLSPRSVRPRGGLKVVAELLARPDKSNFWAVLKQACKSLLVVGDHGVVSISVEALDAVRRQTGSELSGALVLHESAAESEIWSNEYEEAIDALNAMKFVASARRGSVGMEWRK